MQILGGMELGQWPGHAHHSVHQSLEEPREGGTQALRVPGDDRPGEAASEPTGGTK